LGHLETVIVDDEMLRITATRGNTDTAVVTFSGVGMQVDGIPQEEFVKTLQGATHSQFFVVDKVRSWYNATARDIVSTLSPLLGGYRKVVTLGNSMGGFGAIYFASQLPNVRTAVSFSPQFSVNAAVVPGETRWGAYRSRITSWTVRDAMEQARDDPEMLLFFGAGKQEDDQHRILFQTHATDRTAIITLRDAQHGTARHLKRGGMLRQVLDTIIQHDAGATGVAALLAESQVPHTLWTRSAAVR
jgi:pimeloyl-ACP methyl ester carboxylesterase